MIIRYIAECRNARKRGRDLKYLQAECSRQVANLILEPLGWMSLCCCERSALVSLNSRAQAPAGSSHVRYSSSFWGRRRPVHYPDCGGQVQRCRAQIVENRSREVGLRL